MSGLLGKVLLDRYQVLEQVGVGGIAIIYRARDLRRGYDVALKFVDEQRNHSVQHYQSLVSEAQLLTQLQHHNIVRFYGVERDNNGIFLVMDYVDGKSLKDYMSQYKLKLHQIILIIEAVAAALRYIEQERLVHRDVKPGNILIGRDGKVVLSDMNITTSAGEIDPQAVGSPLYMAPEQWRGQALSARTDIYALGVVAFEMLAGQPPFIGNSAYAQGKSLSECIRAEHLNAPIPSILSYRPNLAPGLDAVLSRAMAKAPEERYSNAISFAKSLGKFLDQAQETDDRASAPLPQIEATNFGNSTSADSHEQDRSPSPNKKIVWAVVLTIALIAVVLGLALFSTNLGSTDNPTDSVSVANVTTETIATSTRNVIVSPSPYSTSTRIPSETPTRTNTARPSPTATVTPSRTATTRPRPTATPITLSASIQAEANVNVRRRPSSDASVLVQAAPGESITVLGRNRDSSWVYIRFVDAGMTYTGWVDVNLTSLYPYQLEDLTVIND